MGAPMNRSTSANCSGVLSAGAWPQPGISTTTARGPRLRISSAVSRSSRSESAPRRHSTGRSSASQRLPQVVVVVVMGELHHHARVVVRRHAAVRQTAGRGLGQAAPLRIAQPAVGPVDGAEVLLQLAHGGERRGAAGIAADALDRRRGGLRADVVEHEALDAAAQGGGGRAACRWRRPSTCRASAPGRSRAGRRARWRGARRTRGSIPSRAPGSIG